jgi:hypothetical protein
MEDIDVKISKLEQQVPLDAAGLVRSVYKKAIASGRSVMVSRDGALYRVTSAGSSKIKDIDADVLVSGKNFKLR